MIVAWICASFLANTGTQIIDSSTLENSGWKHTFRDSSPIQFPVLYDLLLPNIDIISCDFVTQSLRRFIRFCMCSECPISACFVHRLQHSNSTEVVKSIVAHETFNIIISYGFMYIIYTINLFIYIFSPCQWAVTLVMLLSQFYFSINIIWR